MSKYYRYINPPQNSINEKLFFEMVESNGEIQQCKSLYWAGKWDHNSSMFTDEFREWLGTFNCKIFKAESFRVFAHTALAWHNDTNDHLPDLVYHETTKINFMWGDLKKSFMEYGELSGSINDHRIVATNKRNRSAYVYDPKAMVVIERFSLEKTVMINRGPTHRVNNESDQDWLCLSCIIVDNETDKPLLYSKAINLFKSVVIP